MASTSRAVESRGMISGCARKHHLGHPIVFPLQLSGATSQRQGRRNQFDPKGKVCMTSTFLGKWRFSFQWSIEYNNFVVYRPYRSGTYSNLWIYTGPPSSDTNIAFIR